MSVHPYAADFTVTADHRGRRPCTCGMPKPNRVHDVPAVDDEIKRVEQRRVGERV